jgi:hypothetical protein
MKYMIMGAEPRGEWEQLDASEQKRRVGYHQQKLNELLEARVRAGVGGLIFASAGLGRERDTATVKFRAGKHLRVDGPFPETKEVIGGFNIIEFPSRDGAIEFARHEHVHHSHVSELRPIREFWWISQFTGSPVAKVFMLTSVEDERAALTLPESELKQLRRLHQAVGAEYVAQRQMIAQEPGLWVGARLAPSTEATTIRWTGGSRHFTDGPFAETREVMGGFNMIACASIDEAITWARKLAVRDGDAIEVRPVDGCWWVHHE